MNESIYNNVVLSELSIVLFLGIYTMNMRISSNSASHINFMRALRVYGSTLLIFGSYLTIMLITNLRFTDPLMATVMAISTYHLNFRLLSIAFSKLLDLKRAERLSTAIISWLVVSLMLVFVLKNIDQQHAKLSLIIILILSCADLLIVGYKTIMLYNNALNTIVSDKNVDLESFIKRIKWYGVLMMAWCIILPVSCFFAIEWLVLISTISVILQLMLTIAFLNYSIDIQPINHTTTPPMDGNKSDNKLDKPIAEWIKAKGYLEHISTIDQVSMVLGTNRTYLSSYINATYKMNFRNWIAELRLEYSKELMISDPSLAISEVAHRVHYTQSSYSSIFKRHYGVSVSQWRLKSGISKK